MKNYYYTYYSYEEWGRGYIGRRGCDCLPEEDSKYFGSFTDKTFKPTQKIILQIFDTEEKASEAEVILHAFYEVHTNPHFANKAKQTSKKFYCNQSPMLGRTGEKHFRFGKSLSLNHKENLSKSKIGKPGMRGEKHPMFGKKHTLETRQKMSESHSGKRMGEKHPMFGKNHSFETKQKLSNASKGRHWYHDGTKNIFTFECPDGFKPGKVKNFTNEDSKTSIEKNQFLSDL